MIRRVEARRYKCLKRVDIRLDPLNILVGPNASGKSTLLDVLSFLRDALESDAEEAIRRRSSTLAELVWAQSDVPEGFEIAVEMDIPKGYIHNGFDRLRYEVGIGLDQAGSIIVSGENLWLINSKQRRTAAASPPTLFPFEPISDEPLVWTRSKRTPAGHRVVVRKVAHGNDYFRSERTDWNIVFRLAPRRLALSGVPEDQGRFPVALWFKQMLSQNIQILQLNSLLMRGTSPSDAPRTFQPDGSNLPIMVAELRDHNPERFKWWIGHLQTILEDIEDITIAERPEDRSRYLMVSYRNGLQVPAWMLSDGTLRLLALTLIAYLPPQDQVFLIEEPENGVHPRAIEAVFKALSSVYDGQVLLATHSPLFLALSDPEHLLVFARAPSGATVVVRGPDHPMLREWPREAALDTLFAAGVLE
jgi:predicted ATPase